MLNRDFKIRIQKEWVRKEPLVRLLYPCPHNTHHGEIRYTKTVLKQTHSND